MRYTWYFKRNDKDAKPEVWRIGKDINEFVRMASQIMNEFTQIIKNSHKKTLFVCKQGVVSKNLTGVEVKEKPLPAPVTTIILPVDPPKPVIEVKKGQIWALRTFERVFRKYKILGPCDCLYDNEFSYGDKNKKRWCLKGLERNDSQHAWDYDSAFTADRSNYTLIEDVVEEVKTSVVFPGFKYTEEKVKFVRRDVELDAFVVSKSGSYALLYVMPQVVSKLASDSAEFCSTFQMGFHCKTEKNVEYYNENTYGINFINNPIAKAE